jgi:Tat protein translocase TatB subunit
LSAQNQQAQRNRRPQEKFVVKSVSRLHCCFSFSGSMMKRMSFSETIFLFVLALIIFGPKKLPEIARQVGKYMNEFKRASNEFKAQIEQEISNLDVEKREVENRQTILPPAPPPQGATSRTPNAASLEIGGADGSVAQLAAAEDHATEVQAAEAASDDEPLFATNAAGTGAVVPSPAESAAVSPSDGVTSATSQESHV